jgi:uncharacterized protein (TIGR03435 family)
MQLFLQHILVASVAFAQPANAPAFEVASVKPLRDLSSPLFRVDHGNLNARMGLQWLIGWAYSVPVTLVAAPEWALPAGIEIDAKAGSAVSEEQVRLMLRTLLADRFHLQVHRETRPTTIMALTVAKDGTHLKKSETEGKFRRRLDTQNLRETYTGATMKEFTDFLAQYYNGTLDHTGLTGRYDFVLEYRSLLDPQSERPVNVAVIDARREALKQVGLRLDPVKQPVEFLVVDRVEKLPTAN